MQPKMLTAQAFRIFYSSNRLVIVTGRVAKLVKKARLDSLDVLLLTPEGVLALPSERVGRTSDLVPAIGAPLGVRGILSELAGQTVAVQWQDWFSEQTGRPAPRLFMLEKKPSSESVLTSIAQCLLSDAEASRISAAKTEKDLAVLRRDFERTLINLEKARRIVRGAGYDTKFTTMSVLVGDGAIEPTKRAADTLAPYVAAFPLPVDAAGLVGVSLHFCMPDEGVADGMLDVSIYRTADKQLLGQKKMPFVDIGGGWAYFELKRPLQRSFGDAELVVSWSFSSEGSAPSLSLSASELDRRHDDRLLVHDRLPAMQLWSGFSPGELEDDDRFRPHHLEAKRNDIASLYQYSRPFGAAAAKPESITVHNESVQTHLQTGVTGLSFVSFVPGSATAIEVSFETAHPEAPPCMYLVAMGVSGIEVTTLDIEEIFEKVQKSGQLSGVDKDKGIIWQAVVVSPKKDMHLRLDVPEALRSDTPSSLVLAVKSTTGKQHYGWCRWNDLSVFLPPVMELAGQLPATFKPVYNQHRRIRSIKFPEVGEQLQFLAGTKALHDLTDSIGFSPMIVGEDNGSLQTHPLLEEVSAALYRGGAPAGTLRVGCDVETAHERAPDFRYVLALIPSDCEDKYKKFKDFVVNDLPKGSLGSRGFVETQGIHYCSRQLKALESSVLSINFDMPLETGFDIIVAALPVQDAVSYGWCRWMSLNVTSSIEAQQHYFLTEQPE